MPINGALVVFECCRTFHRIGGLLTKSMAMESDFHLSKWYMDCISGDGTVVIGYTARLTWKQLTLNYASILRRTPHRSAETAATFFSSDYPVRTGDTIDWICSGVDAAGRWKQRFPSVRKELLKNNDGTIRWSCEMPGAEAQMRVGGETVRGHGYVELLEMTIPPWKLPIDELRWGRFVAPNDAVVWIDWKGTHPLRIVNFNGSMMNCRVLDDASISAGDGTMSLTLDRAHVLRSGPLIETALQKMPMIDSVIPKRLLQTDECKWLSNSTLTSSGIASNGYSIHEIVRFV